MCVSRVGLNKYQSLSVCFFHPALFPPDSAKVWFAISGQRRKEMGF